jgi:hypothetical protein
MARSLLDRVTVTDPCSESWEAMPGDITRHCATCRKNVVDLDALGRHEAEAFLQRHRGQTLCVRLAVVAIAAGCGTAHAPPTPARPTTTVIAIAPDQAEPDPTPISHPAPAPASRGSEPMLERDILADPGSPDVEEPDGGDGTVRMGCACIPDDALCSCL